ncbi:signal peptidase II [Prauserella muralis]|uniref:Lipoprotein signal peptidase n=1 Tax=Prauserella muralis TaxID=588067 RepID=A0A2V4AHW0_9PSEU|nr:signal peptidase II [Prauserella muralis]PXY19505.1 signal peptidase II [Prauserella muralis]TWE29489.1 signal peptidase II [Prauserella muralis]
MSTEQGPDSTAGEKTEPQAPRPKRRIGLVALVAALAYAVDLVTKIIVTATLEGEEPVRILGGLVYLQLLRNPNAAYGLDIGGTWLLAVIAIIVVGVIIWFASRLRSVGWAIGLGLVLAGALGNLTDRIFRAPGVLHGHVVDFISVLEPNGEFFPVFNAADSAITVGAALIVLLSLLGRDYDGTVVARKTKKRSSGDGDDGEDGDGHDASGQERDR